MQVRLLVKRASLAVECSLHEINQVNLGQLDEKSMQRIQFVSVECIKSKCIYFGAIVLVLPPFPFAGVSLFLEAHFWLRLSTELCT